MKKIQFLALVLTILIASIPSWAEPVLVDSFVIELAGQPRADLADRVAAAGGVLDSVLPDLGLAIARSTDPGFAEALARAPGIQAVTQDMEVQWTPSVEEFLGEALAPTELGPANDPTNATFFPCQWNLHNIDAPGAWALGAFGDPNVKVAVLDSGIDPTHQDLVGKVDLAQSVSLLPPGSSPCNAQLGLPDEETFLDFRFHGTVVANQITSNNLGAAAVAPETEIVAVKVNHCGGSGRFSTVIQALQYVANLPDVDIVNMSLGAGFGKNLSGAGPLVAALNKAVNYAQLKGKLVISAAGNSGVDMDHDQNTVWMPAQAGTGIAVSATAYDDSLASYSNYGVSGTWLAAPGGASIDPNPPLPGCGTNPVTQGGVIGACSSFSVFFPVCAPGTFYLLGTTGTSFAAPIVAGVAALVDGQAGGGLNGNQLQAILGNSADDLGKPGVDPLYSRGRVNARKAVE